MTNRALWIASKNALCSMIRFVSQAYGGDDTDWLRDYARQVLADHEDDLTPAMTCFKDLLAKAPVREMARKVEGKNMGVGVCDHCGYRPPFCYFSLNKKCSNIE